MTFTILGEKRWMWENCTSFYWRDRIELSANESGSKSEASGVGEHPEMLKM